MKIVEANVDGKIIPMVIDDSKLPVKSIMQFIKFKEGKGCKQKTLKCYCYFLKKYFEFLKEENITFIEIKTTNLEKFLEKLKIYNTERSSRVIIGVIIIFYKYIGNLNEYKMKYMELEKELNKFRKKLRKKNNKFIAKTLSMDEIEILIDACNNLRDKLFITLLSHAGVRTTEALMLNFNNVDWGNKVIEINESIGNNGALYKLRTIEITDKLCGILNQYFEIYDFSKMGKFPLLMKSKDNMSRLDRNDINNLFRKLRKLTNIDVTPLNIRASLIYRYFEDEDKSWTWGLDLDIEELKYYYRNRS